MAMIAVLINGEMTEREESTLLKTEGTVDNDNELTQWVEYRETPDGEIVHRSVHVHLKQGLFASGAVEGF